MPRIVTLIASATEIVCALGFENDIVGRSHECDFPSSIRDRPVCTEPKFDVQGSSAEIDRRVKDTVKHGLSVYRVDAEKLRELRPDIIVTQMQCEVCAVSERDVEQAVCNWLDSKPKIVTLSPDRLEDVWDNIRTVANALDVPSRGDEVIQRLNERIEIVADKTRSLADRPTVACIEWIEPLMAAGNWVPELVELAGGTNLFGQAGKHAPWMTWEQLQMADPDMIVLMPCGFDIERTKAEMAWLTSRAGWDNLKAARTRRVFITDGNQYFNRPGPRLVDSLEILAELFHPATFSPQHHHAWVRFA
ncbi:MAG: cobalamin-binding protein [Gemmatales bacterium]|nr:MAG: cobalamin-binding protein [Gemmatales bacterium]